MRSSVRFGVALAACFGAGLLGSIFVTDSSLAWIDSLVKPSFYPPNWLFAPVWTILYILMAIALALVWEKDQHAEDGYGWVPLFFAHLLVNASWTIFFFGYQAIFIALVDIVLLWWCVLLLFCGALKIRRVAGYLLLPYLAWVSFAFLLNLSIWYLN